MLVLFQMLRDIDMFINLSHSLFSVAINVAFLKMVYYCRGLYLRLAPSYDVSWKILVGLAFPL